MPCRCRSSSDRELSTNGRWSKVEGWKWKVSLKREEVRNLKNLCKPLLEKSTSCRLLYNRIGTHLQDPDSSATYQSLAMKLTANRPLLNVAAW